MRCGVALVHVHVILNTLATKHKEMVSGQYCSSLLSSNTILAHVPSTSHHTSMCLQSNLILLHLCFQLASQSVARERSQQNECHNISLLFIFILFFTEAVI